MSWTYSVSRVAAPMQSTSTPVASGSSVPAWPILVFRGSLAWMRFTTSREVIPPGLSMTRNPLRLLRFSGIGIFAGHCGMQDDAGPLTPAQPGPEASALVVVREDKDMDLVDPL